VLIGKKYKQGKAFLFWSIAMSKHTYADLIDQSYDFPNDIFSLDAK
jgi:hypothetical protein